MFWLELVGRRDVSVVMVMALTVQAVALDAVQVSRHQLHITLLLKTEEQKRLKNADMS